MEKKKRNWKQVFLWILLFIVSGIIGIGGMELIATYMPNFSFIDIILGFLVFILSIPLHIVLHEAGHLIGGLLSGYQFIMFRLFHTVWIKTNEGISRRKQVVQGLLGQALMAPPENEENPPFLLYHSSGLIVNLATALLMFYAGWVISNPSVAFLLFLSGGVAFFLFITNIIPMKGNDGYNIVQHYKRPETLAETTNILHLYGGMVRGESFVNLQRYITLDSPKSFENPNTVTFYTAQAAAAFEQYDFNEACKIYQDLWRNRTQLMDLHKPEIYFNYLFCLFLTEPAHEDILKIKETTIYKNYLKMKAADTFKVRAAEAIYAEEDVDKATILLDEGEKLIATAPTISEEKLERHLYAYLREEIQRLIDAK